MNYEATQTFRLQGVTVNAGDLLPERWPGNLVQRIVAKGLAKPSDRQHPGWSSAPIPNRNAVPSVVGEGTDISGVSIVVLSCYPDIFAPLREGLDRWEPDVRKIVVTSGALAFNAPGWDVLPGIEPFCFGRNANAGIAACEDDDILLLNDDVRIRRPIVAALKQLAHSQEDIGILAPQVIGGCGNTVQQARFHITEDFAFPQQRLAFIAVYLKRSVLERVGPFDERFFGYGSEDSDYSFRVGMADLKCAVTPRVVVLHGHGKTTSSSSFLRKMTYDQQRASMMDMRKLLNQKWQKSEEKPQVFHKQEAKTCA